MSDERFTPSGIPLKPVYTAKDIADLDPESDIGDPGKSPFVRGIYPTMYRDQPWAIVENTGFDLASDTSRRSQMYVKEGARHYRDRGSVHLVFDLPTLYGYDADQPGISYEVGKNGVHINSLRDMEDMFAGFDLEKTHVSFVPYGVSSIIFAMYLALAEKRGIPWDRLSGAIDNCPLLGPLGENCVIFPSEPTLRLVVDAIKFGVSRVPRFNLFVVPVYSIRERGGNAIHELGIGLAVARLAMERARQAGVKPEDLSSRFLFFLSIDNHLFEEVAKLRALRKMWRRIMLQQFGVADPRYSAVRLYVMPGGSTLQAQQPLNNIVRCALHGLVGALGGVQVMGMPAYDEALCIPTEEAGRLAVHTQRIIMHETGVTDVADPLGGSYYIEWLTHRLEVEALQYLDRIDKMGGYVKALESGMLLSDLDAAAFEQQRQLKTGEKKVVGVNMLPEPPAEGEVFRYNQATPKKALERLQALRQSRNAGKVSSALAAVKAAAAGRGDMMPTILDAVRAYATTGEIAGVLREVFGEARGLGM
ncbi:MAG: methylmalonyl-CoA mutase [Chloroflexi bacterium]|nr:methylmalonyl-CoA mutase [Chloroflexota bacterium]